MSDPSRPAELQRTRRDKRGQTIEVMPVASSSSDKPRKLPKSKARRRPLSSSSKPEASHTMGSVFGKTEEFHTPKHITASNNAVKKTQQRLKKVAPTIRNKLKRLRNIKGRFTRKTRTRAKRVGRNIHTNSKMMTTALMGGIQ